MFDKKGWFKYWYCKENPKLSSSDYSTINYGKMDGCPKGRKEVSE